jgi:adenine-specific DNA-methyltransferase
MQKLTAYDPETKTPDLVADNVAKLRALFPELLTEGQDGVSVNLDVLKQLVGDKTVTDAEEKYGLNWHGKRKARQLALTPSTGTLRPCPEDSVDWDTTKNIMIEGDNLEVLKLLQKSYAGKVKLIYIDPPYNTGKDFVYPDNFQDNIKNYLELTGQTGEGGKKLSSNTEASGRFHTDWLNMMYPRLKLARNLLREDGVIFVSIDDSEVPNLRRLLDEVFGEECFVAQVVWEKLYTTKNDAALLSQCHEYALAYVKSPDSTAIQLLPRTDEMDARYTNPDNDPRGPWKAIPLYAKGERKNGRYAVVSPTTGKEHWPGPDSHWLYVEADTKALIADNRISFGRDGNAQPNVKRFLSEVQQGTKSRTLWKHSDVGSNDSAKRELRELYADEQIPFDFPKPTTLLTRMLLSRPLKVNLTL